MGSEFFKICVYYLFIYCVLIYFERVGLTVLFLSGGKGKQSCIGQYESSISTRKGKYMRWPETDLFPASESK